ncbi:MAG TPA: NYN domain-containing protein [Limnobacter sp.]|uniref:NYN domain-containing protein n=1 Tax=Limnobacter sp. TaxID=2003368 RepID=UPI002EDAA2A6
MLTAILVDGPFFVRRIRQIFPSTIHYDAKVMADLVWRLSAAHLFERNQPKRHLFRIFFYDSPVFTQRVTLPVSRQAIDLSKSKEGQFRAAFQRQLQRKRKLAVRLGEPMDVESWKLNDDALADLLGKKITVDDLADEDFSPDSHARGIELKMGVDLASLAYKRQVQQVVLLTGDGAFSSAAELLRHEGIDVVLDPMWQNISEDLFSYIDGLRSTCPPPDRAADFLSRINSDNFDQEELPG